MRGGVFKASRALSKQQLLGMKSEWGLLRDGDSEEEEVVAASLCTSAHLRLFGMQCSRQAN